MRVFSQFFRDFCEIRFIKRREKYSKAADGPQKRWRTFWFVFFSYKLISSVRSVCLFTYWPNRCFCFHPFKVENKTVIVWPHAAVRISNVNVWLQWIFWSECVLMRQSGLLRAARCHHQREFPLWRNAITKWWVVFINELLLFCLRFNWLRR